MATPNVGILTTAGKALIDKVNSGQAKISFSKIVFSSMDNSQLSDMQVKALTAIAPQEVVVSSPETTLDTNSGETRIRATGTNEKLADGVYVKTYGVFAKDDTGSEILYGVTVSPNPNYFPAYDGVTPQAVTYSYKTVIQETSNITMTNSNDVYASQEDLTEAIAAIPLATKADDSKAVHNSGNEEIGGQKTFDVAPIDKTTGNPYITKSDLNNGLSTKVTDNHDGTITANNVSYDLSKTGITPIGAIYSGSFNDLPLGTVFASNKVTDGPDKIHAFTTTTFSFNSWNPGRKAQIAIADSANLMYFRVYTGASWNSWTLLSDDSKVVHSTDMRKPASDVAGIEEVNAKQDKIGYTPADDSKVLHSTVTKLNSTDMNTVVTAGFYELASGTNGMPKADAWTIYQVIPLSSANGVQLAYGTNNTILGMRSWNGNSGSRGFTSWVQFADDSKVAHLSGANNFNTVPTVNNNPLLLASSLPSDLARTGSNQEFTGKNTFDTAPIDKTTGNPYITKDGVPAVPSTLADTTKPANFTAGLQSGGVDVATAADLKSVEDASWLSLGMPKGSYKTSSLSIDNTLLGSPLYMKYDTDTEITTLSGSFLLFFNGNTRDIRSWYGTLITLPDGFYVSDEDLTQFVEFLVSDTKGVKINSASKSGNDIIASLNYADYMVPSGYSFGITVSGADGSDHRQYVTSRTTKLIKKY